MLDCEEPALTCLAAHLNRDCVLAVLTHLTLLCPAGERGGGGGGTAGRAAARLHTACLGLVDREASWLLQSDGWEVGHTSNNSLHWSTINWLF